MIKGEDFMDKEYLIKKWLKDELTAEERQAFEQLEDYGDYQAVIDHAAHFKASGISEVSDFETFKANYKAGNKPNRVHWLNPLLRVAAVLVVALGAYFLVFTNDMVEVKTLASEKTTITLPDASEVILNADSEIAYNKNDWSNNRALELEGEAYFKVAKGKQFDVLTEAGTVTVVGTAFNVKQRSEYFEVQCYEGIVRVSADTIIRQLKAGDTYKILNGKFTEGNTIHQEPQWTKNISSFEAIPLKEVLAELERQYNMEVSYQKVDVERLFTGGFTHDNLKNALISITKPMGLTYELNTSNDIVIIHGKKIKYFLVLNVIFMFTMGAQEADGKLPLSEIFTALEEKHQVVFNYAADTIEHITIKPPGDTLSLQDTLNYLEQATGLEFTLISDNFILVKERDAYVLCGYLKDSETLQPLSSATIQGVINSAVSDEQGFFRITLDNVTEEVTIRHLGYKSVKRSFNILPSETCQDIYLEPEVLSLSEVVIFKYITEGISKMSDGSYKVDFSDFDILPGMTDTDVLQSVQAFPGIMSVNETVSNINIRGGTHDQNLILWDGIKMYQSGHFFGLISMYNPQITQKVSLSKNGSDVTLTDGVSGTISMQTDQTLNTDFSGSIGANLIDINGFADVPLGSKSSLQVAGRKAISDLIETPTYSAFFDRISQDTEVAANTADVINSDKSFDFYDASLRWIYNISENDELRLNFITVSNDLVFNENAVVDSEEESRESSVTQNSIAGALYYKRRWHNKLETIFEGYETDYKLKAINANVLDSQRFLQENVVSETSLKLKAYYAMNDQWRLLNGYHFVETEVTNLDDVDAPIYRLLISEVVRTHGIFSQIDYTSPNNRTHIKAGIRFNYLDKFKKQIWEPRLAISQKLLSDVTVEVLGEFKHQNTSQVINFQNDFLGIEKRRWQLSNDEDIPVIKSKQLSVGLSYDNEGWLASAEGYYKEVEGITSQSQGFQNQFEFERTSGSYKVTGIDVLLRKKLNHLNGWLSYSFMDNTYTFSTLSETTFPSNYDITHTVTAGAAYTVNNFKVSIGLHWHTGKPATIPQAGNEIVDNTVNFDTPNTERINDYMRVDFSALYDFKLGLKSKARVGLSLWNVLDRENDINNFYRVNNGIVNETVQRSLGFTPNILCRVHF